MSRRFEMRSIMIVFILVLGLLIQGCNDKKQKVDVRVIDTVYGDKFYVEEELLANFPDYSYDYSIYEYSAKQKGQLLFSMEAEGVDLTEQFIIGKMRCYVINGYIIYKDNNQEDFEVFHYWDFDELDPKKEPELVPIAQRLFLINWDWADNVVEFLLKSKDKKSYLTIQRYADGDFLPEELARNTTYRTTKEDVQEYCKEILKKYPM